MDILAHSLWTNLMYKLVPVTNSDRRTTWWGIFFGVFPDFFAFGPGFIYIFYRLIFLGQSFRFGSPEDSNGSLPLDALSHQLYNYSHSLVVWAAMFVLVWLVLRKFPWVLLGWALHIVIDMFTHTSKFYPTPFLWPVSNFHVEGKSWGDPVFMIINYSALLLVYLFVIPKLLKRQERKHDGYTAAK